MNMPLQCVPMITPIHVAHLVEKGFTFVDGFDSDIVQKSLELPLHFKRLLERWDPSHWDKITFEREKRPDGKYEPDDGFIASEAVRIGPGLPKDGKFRFHYREDLEKVIAESHHDVYSGFLRDVQMFMCDCAEVFAYRTEVFRELATVMSSDLRLRHILKEVEECLSHPGETSRSVLRVLYYPPRTGESMAKTHFDRSFVTIHGPHAGGELFLHMADGTDVVVDTTPGQLLIMLGEKARLITLDSHVQLSPVAHGVRTRVPHEERIAVASFHHVNQVLWDAPVPRY